MPCRRSHSRRALRITPTSPPTNPNLQTNYFGLSFASHREDLIKRVDDVHALHDASEVLLEKQTRLTLPLDVEATLQQKDAHIDMLTERK